MKKMHILIYVFCLIAAVYAGILLFAGFFADVLIFPAPAPTYSESECLFFDSAGGEKLAAKYLPAGNVCIVYSHGNGEDLGMISSLLEQYRSEGLSVFAYDYPGYGRSSGKASVENFIAAADAALGYVKNNLGYAPENIVAIGYSLGGAAAVRMAEIEPNLRALVLIGAFASAPLAVLPKDIIPWDILENRKKLSKFHRPVLFLHGDSDFIVPARNARLNYASANEPKKLVWFRGMGHYKLFDEKKYWDEILSLALSGKFCDK